MTTLDRVLNSLYPGAEWSLDGDTYEGLIWHTDTPKPTEEELEAARETVAAEIEAQQNATEELKAAIVARLGLTVEELKLILE